MVQMRINVNHVFRVIISIYLKNASDALKYVRHVQVLQLVSPATPIELGSTAPAQLLQISLQALTIPPYLYGAALVLKPLSLLNFQMTGLL